MYKTKVKKKTFGYEGWNRVPQIRSKDIIVLENFLLTLPLKKSFIFL